MSSWFTAPLPQALPWPQLQSFGSGMSLANWMPHIQGPQQPQPQPMPMASPPQDMPQMQGQPGGGGGGGQYPPLPPFGWPQNPWQVSGNYPPVTPDTLIPSFYIPPDMGTPQVGPAPVPGGYSGVWGQLGNPTQQPSLTVTGQILPVEPQTAQTGTWIDTTGNSLGGSYGDGGG